MANGTSDSQNRRNRLAHSSSRPFPIVWSLPPAATEDTGARPLLWPSLPFWKRQPSRPGLGRERHDRHKLIDLQIASRRFKAPSTRATPLLASTPMFDFVKLNAAIRPTDDDTISRCP